MEIIPIHVLSSSQVYKTITIYIERTRAMYLIDVNNILYISFKFDHVEGRKCIRETQIQADILSRKK